MSTDLTESATNVTPADESWTTYDGSDATSSRKTPQRKQTAFYPNMNASNKPLKPFSRSAAKRESVMTLGSIEHLQHYFTKTGIAAKENPFKRNTGGVPAIGGLARLNKPNPSLGSILEFELPPSPHIPAVVRPPFPHFEKTYETDPETLKPGVIQDLETVARAWEFNDELSAGAGSSMGKDTATGTMNWDFDVLLTLQITTRAIRSVRNYLLSLPDDTTPTQSSRHQFRPGSFSPAPKKSPTPSRSPSEPLTRIRTSALDVLSVLRMLEESSRLPLTDDAYDAQSDQGSSSSPRRSPHAALHSRPTSPSVMLSDDSIDPDASFAFSVVSVPGREDGVPVWTEEEESPDEEEGEKREVWDQRLVLGSGWLYKQDIHLEDLHKEREAVSKYLDIVDEVLFGGPKGDQRGWVRAAAERRKSELDRQGRSKRRVSSGDIERRASPSPGPSFTPGLGTVGNRRVVSAADMLSALRSFPVTEEEETEGATDEDSVDDEELPDWAKRSSHFNDPLGRAHALLMSLLPPDLLPLLPFPAPERAQLLEALSSGQLLCLAYNAGVRRSRKPWGYINKDAVHDIATLEAQYSVFGTQSSPDKDQEKRRTGWTFRRTDNLRLWGAALKLRYLIPLVTPNSNLFVGGDTTPQSGSGTPVGTLTPTKPKFSSHMGPPVYFDARLVARKDEGWEAMLESAVLAWVNVVNEEIKGAR